MRVMEHTADTMERTCGEPSNFRSDPIRHGHGHGHGKIEPVQGHTLGTHDADVRGWPSRGMPRYNDSRSFRGVRSLARPLLTAAP